MALNPSAVETAQGGTDLPSDFKVLTLPLCQKPTLSSC
jgi:hypothetical protein